MHTRFEYIRIIKIIILTILTHTNAATRVPKRDRAVVVARGEQVDIATAPFRGGAPLDLYAYMT